MSLNNSYGKAKKHGDAQSEVRKIKDKLSKKYGKNADSIIDREILAAINKMDRTSQSPSRRDCKFSEEEVDQNIARKLDAMPKTLNYQFQPFVSPQRRIKQQGGDASVTSYSQIDQVSKLSSNRNMHYRRSSQGGAMEDSHMPLNFTSSPKNARNGQTHRHTRKTNLRSDSSPTEKLAFLQELKAEQKKMLNKSNVKASLFDLINKEHSISNLNAVSPRSGKKGGFSHAGATDVDKQLLNARTSLHSLLHRSMDRRSQEDFENSPSDYQTLEPKNILDEGLIPKKAEEIVRDVQKQHQKHVSPSLRSSFMPYSYNVTQRSGDYQTLESPMKKLKKNLHDQMLDSQSKGVYENFLGPVHAKGSFKSSMGILKNKTAKYQGGIAGIANGWNTQTNHFKSYHDNEQQMGRTARNRSILTSGIENKFDLKNTIVDQALGGPGKRTNITMWDLMTLYDVNKKRQEDETAFKQCQQQQRDLKNFYDSQVDHKHEIRKWEQHLKDNDLKDIRNKHATLLQFENSYETNKKNYLTDLNLQNKLEVHQNRQNRDRHSHTVDAKVNAKYRHDDQVYGAATRFQEHKDKNKKTMVNNQLLAQIKENRMKRETDLFNEQNKQAREEAEQEAMANKRDHDLAQHHKRIADRDAEIFGIFNRPEQITQAKLEMHRTQHIHNLSDAMNKKEQLRQMKWFKDKKDRSDDLLAEMVTRNDLAKLQQRKEKMNQTMQHDQQRKMRGTMGKINKFTVGQVNEMADIQLKETADQLTKKRYMVDLQRQIQDKKLREETHRIFLDPKQMATSSKLMEKVNPELFEGKAGDTAQLLRNDNIFDKECQEMGSVKLTQLFMGTQLRSQRFKD